MLATTSRSWCRRPKGTFGEFLVEVGPQPIVTSNGLILLLHNAAVKFEDGTVRYTCGQLLFDPKRPTEIMAQMSYPWLEPSTYEDQHGLVSNVTFVEGLVHFKDTWFAYYGQSDSTLGVATYKVGDTLQQPLMSWLTTPAHARWLEAEGDRLLGVRAGGRASRRRVRVAVGRRHAPSSTGPSSSGSPAG